MVVGVATALSVLACGGAPGGPGKPFLVDDRERGVRYTVPPLWVSFGDETRSPGGSVFTVETFSLVGAAHGFVERLPDSLIPQLDARTRYYFSAVEPAEKRPATIASLPATEVSFRVRVRAQDAEGRVIYWIVRRGDLLYALRVTYPPGQQEKDEPALRSILGSWQFFDITPPA